MRVNGDRADKVKMDSEFFTMFLRSWEGGQTRHIRGDAVET